MLVAGFDRPNIYLRVERVEDEDDKDDQLPSLVRGRRALVYAATRKTAAAAAAVLQAAGVRAAAYHAGLKRCRRRNAEYLIDGPRRDTREHKAAARDPEEIGRRKALEHRKLARMIEYADTPACLRATILHYFGDAAARERCDACGNCRPGAIDAYEHALVRKILSGIVRAGERYGRHRIVAMLLGESGDLPPALASLSTTGLLRHETPDALRGWIDASIGAGLIVVSKDQYRTLSLTDRGRDAMRGRARQLEIRRPAGGTVRPGRRRHRANRLREWSFEAMPRSRLWSPRVDMGFEDPD